MYLEKRFEQLASSDEDIKKLYAIWGVLKEQLVKVLDGVTQYFPHFSLHNDAHSKEIALQIERVLGKERIDLLSASDIWLLLMAFYSHDIGMAVKFEEVKAFFNSNEFKEKLNELSTSKKNDIAATAGRLLCCTKYENGRQCEQSLQHFNDIRFIIETCFRNTHAERSRKYIDEIMASFNRYGAINIRFVELLGKVCMSHQENIEDLMNLPYETNGMVGDYAHPRFVAAMLCLGDLLDLDTDRFNEAMLEIIDPLPESSEVHLNKHKAIKHFLINVDGIEIVSDSEDYEVNRELKSWTQYLKEAINFINLQWSEIAPNDFGAPPKVKSIKHLMNGNEKWSKFSSLAFKMDNDRAISLLKGSNIYSDKFIFIREVIQNSIDASIMQMWQELMNRDQNVYNSETKIQVVKKADFDKYPIDIKLSTNENGKCEFIIHDMGIGIEASDLENIAKVGDSNISKKRELLRNMPNWLKPSGVFGLGLQSIFMVSDSFEVISKTDSANAIKIRFESGNKGYISVSDYNGHFTRGTKTTIIIDSDKILTSDFYYPNNELEIKLRATNKLIAERIYEEFYSFLPEQKSLYQYGFFNIDLTINRGTLKEVKEKICEQKIFNDIVTDISESGRYPGFEFAYYDEDRKILCQMSIREPNKNDKIITDIKASINHYNDVYFRGSFVENHNMKAYFHKAIFAYIGVNINILDGVSDKYLNIDRKEFTVEGRKLVEDKIDCVVRKSLKIYLDIILKQPVGNIKEYCVCLYQICRYLNYKEEEFENMYFSELENYRFKKIGKYHIVRDNKSEALSFSEIEQCKKWIVQGNKFNIIDSSKELYLSLPEFPQINGKKVWLTKKELQIRKSVISCKEIKKCFYRDADVIYECLEIEPLNISDNKLLDYDELSKINEYLGAIKRDGYKRTIIGQKNFELLTIILCSEYRIELPFEPRHFAQLKDELTINSNVPFDVIAFKDDILKSKYFDAVVNYVSDSKQINVEDVRKEYIKFLDEMLGLLFENTLYKNYICKQMLEKYEDEPWMDED